MPNRCAIYYAPAASSALWQFGSSVLGYDADTGAAVPHPGTDMPWADLTATPRRYGFHATLKAPFHLATGVTVDHVIAAAHAFAASTAPVHLGRLVVRRVGRQAHFVALVPTGDFAPASDLAQRAVEAFDHLRAPLDAADEERFRAKGLTARQADNLARFGYPYTGADFMFHMTLSDPLPQAPGRARDVDALARRAAALYAPLADETVRIDQIAVYEQPDRASPFRIRARAMLAGA